VNQLKTINAVLLTSFLSLQYALWAGNKNVFDLYHQNNKIDSLTLTIEQLTLRNDQFLAQVLDLKSGGQAIETLARQELGYVREGEVFYQIIESQ
jgi:cell division protein FtsB